jgi:hypothetical protein
MFQSDRMNSVMALGALVLAVTLAVAVVLR